MRTGFSPNLHSPEWSILCDFDGTIAVDDVVDLLLERYGLAGWESLEQRWRNGQIGSLECMRGQVELLDMGLVELHACVDSVAIDPAFHGFVAKARALAMPIRIVSDGLDYPIRRILARHGLSDLPVVANEMVRAGAPRRWRLNAPFAATGCRSGTCKCAQVESAREGQVNLSLLVGDGASDFCVAGQADFVFAKNKLIDYCRLEGIPHRPIAGFADATKLLSTLTELGQALSSNSLLVQPTV